MKKKLARTFWKEFSSVFRNPMCIGNSFSSYSKKVRFWQLWQHAIIIIIRRRRREEEEEEEEKNITGICINRGCKVAYFQRYIVQYFPDNF